MEYRLHSKDLARSYATSVEPLWDAAILECMQPYLPTPPGSTLLVARCGAGRACQVLVETVANARIMAVDPSRDMLDEARARFEESDGHSVFFNCQSARQLSYATGVFAQAVCLNGHGAGRRFDNLVAELNRVVRSSGMLAIAAPMGSSVALFCDLLAEALWALDQPEILVKLGEYRSRLLEADGFRASVTNRGSTILGSGSLRITLPLESVDRLLLAPLMQHLFISDWLDLLPAPQPRNRLLADVLHRLGSYVNELPFHIDIDAEWLVAETSTDRREEIYEPEDLGIEEVDESSGDDSSSDLFDPLDDGLEPRT